MSESPIPLVPFGKYKDKPITDLLSDVKYLEWCKNQEWFKKYPIIYNICVNQTITNSNTNSKTPEHNKIQNIFLEHENTWQFAKYLLKIGVFDCGVEIKHTIEVCVEGTEFEGIFNWDCIIGCVSIYQNCTSKIKNKDFPDHFSNCCKKEQSDIGHDRSLFIEIKPLLGDDYPSVLRKMKLQIQLTEKNEKGDYHYHKKYILLIGEFSALSATKEQLISIFKQADIYVVFVNEVGFKIENVEHKTQDLSTLQKENAKLKELILQYDNKIKKITEDSEEKFSQLKAIILKLNQKYD